MRPDGDMVLEYRSAASGGEAYSVLGNGMAAIGSSPDLPAATSVGALSADCVEKVACHDDSLLIHFSE
jgi:hypothetical protein